MTQLRPYRSASPSGTGTSVRRILLAAVLAAACGDATGPRTAAEPPPADEMRVASLTITDSAYRATTRHRFLYDEAGRLKRVNFYINQVPGGPPDRLAHYTEHTYAGGLLRESSHFSLTRGGSEFVNWKQVEYDYDRRGYRIRETARRRLSPDVVGEPTADVLVSRFRYDRQGRLVERVDEPGDRTVYSYGADGLLAQMEIRYPDGHTFRQTFSYAGGRNPFYRRLAHVNSLSLPHALESTLLAPANPALLEKRWDDPAVAESVGHEYQFDSAGRPLHIRQVLSYQLPRPQTVVLRFDFEYEPAGG